MTASIWSRSCRTGGHRPTSAALPVRVVAPSLRRRSGVPICRARTGGATMTHTYDYDFATGTLRDEVRGAYSRDGGYSRRDGHSRRDGRSRRETVERLDKLATL